MVLESYGFVHRKELRLCTKVRKPTAIDCHKNNFSPCNASTQFYSTVFPRLPCRAHPYNVKNKVVFQTIFSSFKMMPKFVSSIINQEDVAFKVLHLQGRRSPTPHQSCSSFNLLPLEVLKRVSALHNPFQPLCLRFANLPSTLRGITWGI